MKNLIAENPEKILFCITEEDLQSEAKQILGRQLNEEEVLIAKKGLSYGITTSIDIIYNTIFNEMIDNSLLQ